MSDIIQLLPDSVANQIAAGEVILRPASVVKEMMENSVDAGAKNIDVIIVDAGRTQIQIVDDGKGMSATDARLSFERHATSKIRNADDLFSLHTMGFRGEALPSIAAVARVDLKTRQEGEQLGTHIVISGSKVTEQELCACPTGCNFSVENLFYNVPVRRKFLKSNTTELNNIIAVFNRVALVYPDISFKLISNGSELLNLPTANLRQRIIDIFGKRMNQYLLPVDTDTTMCKIYGFVGKPESAKKKGAQQYFFVNGRFMRHSYFHKAVVTAFDRLLPAGEQVPYFIYFDVPTDSIDVNIDPTKTEIKFENEQAVWQILMAVVKEAVGLFSDVPSIDFDSSDTPNIPVYNPTISPKMPKISGDATYNPFDCNDKMQKAPANWEQLYDVEKKRPSGGDLFAKNDEENYFDRPSDNAQDGFSTHSEDKSPSHYQYKGRFIMTAVKSGLMIVEQNRAHIRILYERYLENIRRHRSVSQKMLFPEIIEIAPTYTAMFAQILPEVEALGFEFSDLGGGTYAVNAMPGGLEGLSCQNIIADIVASARDVSTVNIDEVNHVTALSLARAAAIPVGQVLGNDEMENIVNELFACDNARYTPDGKPIIGTLSQQEIEHLF